MIRHLFNKLQNEVYYFEVRRDHVLDDLLHEVQSESFHPKKRIKTWFIGENGADTGGLTREMWTIFVKELREGREYHLIFKHDGTRLQVVFEGNVSYFLLLGRSFSENWNVNRDVNYPRRFWIPLFFCVNL